MVHWPGVTNQNAHAISRMEDLQETPEDAGEEERLDLEEDVYVLEDGGSRIGLRPTRYSSSVLTGSWAKS